MKIRSNYVSNSSSSSFIVTKDLTNEGIACLLTFCVVMHAEDHPPRIGVSFREVVETIDLVFRWCESVELLPLPKNDFRQASQCYHGSSSGKTTEQHKEGSVLV